MILPETAKVTLVVLILPLKSLASKALGKNLATIKFDCSDFVLSQLGINGIVG